MLGGIASFSIVDGSKVAAADLGNNFFLEAESLGAPRAQSVARLLMELNEQVAGSFVEEEPAALLAANPAFFQAFDIVIATQVLISEDLHSLSASAIYALLFLFGRLSSSVLQHRASCEWRISPKCCQVPCTAVAHPSA